MVILNWDKVDFKTKSNSRDKEGHFKITKGLTQQESIKILILLAANNYKQKYSQSKNWLKERQIGNSPHN